MTPARWIHLSGWGMILGAASHLLTFLPQEASPAGLSTLPFLLAILVTSACMLGLRAAYSGPPRGAATIALGVGVVGGGAAAANNLLWAIRYEGGRPLMNLCMAIMFAGRFVFGLAALREKTMVRGNGPPVLAGIGWPLIVVSSIYPRLTGTRLDVPYWTSFGLFLAMSLFLALLGYHLQAEARSASGSSV